MTAFREFGIGFHGDDYTLHIGHTPWGLCLYTYRRDGQPAFRVLAQFPSEDAANTFADWLSELSGVPRAGSDDPRGGGEQ